MQRFTPITSLPIHAEHLSVALGDRPVLRGLSFDVPPGTWIGVLGPNGSGKTTLLRTLAGLLPFDGSLTLGGTPLPDWSRRDLAQRIAFVRQHPNVAFDFAVRDFVRMGRAPHKRWLQPYDADDRHRLDAVLDRLDLHGFAERTLPHLSGGEQQRVLLAQALMQDPAVLLLDEPTNHLDVRHVFALMENVRALAAEGRTVIAAFHDLELAARFADRLLVLHDGHLAAYGPPVDVLTPHLIARVFEMDASVTTEPDTGLRVRYHGVAAESATVMSDE